MKHSTEGNRSGHYLVGGDKQQFGSNDVVNKVHTCLRPIRATL